MNICHTQSVVIIDQNIATVERLCEHCVAHGYEHWVALTLSDLDETLEYLSIMQIKPIVLVEFKFLMQNKAYFFEKKESCFARLIVMCSWSALRALKEDPTLTTLDFVIKPIPLIILPSIINGTF